MSIQMPALQNTGHIVHRISLILCISHLMFIAPVHTQSGSKLIKNISLAYFGKSVTRPGLKVGTALVLHPFKTHIRKTGKEVQTQIIFSPHVGFYDHVGNSRGLFVNTGIGFQAIYPKGFSWQIDAGAGYLRTFLAGKTYEVNDKGEVRRIHLAGNNQFMPDAGITLGKYITEKSASSRLVYTRIGGFLQYPYNTMWLPNITLEIGTVIKL